MTQTSSSEKNFSRLSPAQMAPFGRHHSGAIWPRARRRQTTCHASQLVCQRTGGARSLAGWLASSTSPWARRARASRWLARELAARARSLGATARCRRSQLLVALASASGPRGGGRIQSERESHSSRNPIPIGWQKVGPKQTSKTRQRQGEERPSKASSRTSVRPAFVPFGEFASLRFCCERARVPSRFITARSKHAHRSAQRPAAAAAETTATVQQVSSDPSGRTRAIWPTKVSRADGRRRASRSASIFLAASFAPARPSASASEKGVGPLDRGARPLACQTTLGKQGQWTPVERRRRRSAGPTALD